MAVKSKGAIPRTGGAQAAGVGMRFPLASQWAMHGGSFTVSRLFTADSVGASLGALLSSTLLIPLLGVPAVCLNTAGLNLLAASAVFRDRSDR